MASGEKQAKKALKKSRKSEAQLELERQAKQHIRRIKRFVKAATARGYTFPDNVFPTLPKRITAGTIRRLEKIRPETLYKKAVYTSPEGVKITGLKRRSQERSEASKKGAETRRRKFIEGRGAHVGGEGPAAEPPKEAKFALNTIEEILFLIDNREIKAEWWKNKDALGHYKEQDAGLLRAALEQAIARDGRDAVAQVVADHADEIGELVTEVLYGSGDDYRQTGREGKNRLIQKFAAILKGRPLTVREARELTDLGEEA